METKTQYDREWFKARAFSSLKKIAPGEWDYSDSLLLYISPSGSETYETLQETDSPYFNLITKPEREYLSAIAKEVTHMLPEHFDYIDLGPGTEHKEQFFFDELIKSGKTFTYIPVDISQHFLDLAEKHASDQNIPFRGMRSSFEELPAKLGSPEIPRFVSLGLTFSNYDPQEVLSLLKNIAGAGGYVFINAQMRDRVDMEKLQEIYALDALHMCDEKLGLLGLNPATDVTVPEATQDIKVWCTVTQSNPELEEKEVKPGDRLLIFQSLRYTKESLNQELKDSFAELFDTGSSFIAALIRT